MGDRGNIELEAIYSGQVSKFSMPNDQLHIVPLGSFLYFSVDEHIFLGRRPRHYPQPYVGLPLTSLESQHVAFVLQIYTSLG